MVGHLADRVGFPIGYDPRDASIQFRHRDQWHRRFCGLVQSELYRSRWPLEANFDVDRSPFLRHLSGTHSDICHHPRDLSSDQFGYATGDSQLGGDDLAGGLSHRSDLDRR